MSEQTPITTLTLNPAVDVSYQVQQLVSGTKIGATQTSYAAGGNGINISRSLKRLGKDSHACCVFAGESGNLIRRLLQEEEVYPVSIQVSGETRINCTILQRRPPDEFKVAGVGPQLNKDQVNEISKIFLKLAGKGYGVLSGSLPDGAPDNVYTKLARKLRKQGARAVVDTRAAVLRDTLASGPFLITPNKYELEVMSGRSLSSLEAIAEEARKIQQAGADNVCVTLGSEGALLVNADNSFYATAPKVRVRCTVGAGDSMLAGLLAAFSENQSAEDTIKLGIACATSSITKNAASLFSPKDLPRFQELIEVSTLSI